MSRSQETSGQDKKQDKTLALPLKKPWTDPKFSRYGSVAELTAGGTGSVVEAGNMASNKQLP